MNKKSNRIFSLMLAVMLIICSISALSVTAFAETSIESISAVATRTYIKDVDTNIAFYYDSETGEEYYYNKYNISPYAFEYTITYDGGQKFIGGYNEITKKFGTDLWIEIIDDQSYTNQWDIGTHTVTITYASKSCEAEIEIIENPIQSISAVVSDNLTENIDGYFRNYDTETNTAVDDCFVYDPSVKSFDITVTYKNGETVTGNQDEIFKAFNSTYWINFSTDQSYANQWDVGKHNVRIMFMGKTCDVEIEILPCPYKSISISGENELIISFVKTDDTVVTAKALMLDALLGDVGQIGGTLTTDKGDFCHVSFECLFDLENPSVGNQYDKELTLTIGAFKSNTLDNCKWLKMLECGNNVLNIVDVFPSLNIFDGRITAKNIDDAILLSYLIYNYDLYSNQNQVEIDGITYYIFDVESVKSHLNLLFDAEDVGYPFLLL